MTSVIDMRYHVLSRNNLIIIIKNFYWEALILTLKDGKTGMTLKIQQIGDSDLKERLMTMGLTPGTKVKVLRSAPLGDPIAIGVRSYNLALRRDDAAKVQVQQVN